VDTLLSLQDVSAGYGPVPVLRGVDWDVRAGELWAVLGPNGTGKSTLLRGVLGGGPWVRGGIHLLGRERGQWEARALARRVAWVPQTFEPVEGFRGLELVLMGRSPHLGLWGLTSASDETLAREVLEELGVAYLAGYGWGLRRDYSAFVQMDADLSHLPEQVPHLLRALDGADLVLGTRWMPGGDVVNWPASRRWLSRGGNAYTRVVLGLPLRDATGGFRAFRRSTLERLSLQDVASAGYCFQVDLATRAAHAGLVIREVPITFVERVHGRSKMSGSIVRESLVRVTAWGVSHRAQQVGDVLWAHRRKGR